MDIQELERLNKMIKLMPRNADAYFYRGYFHLEQGQFEKALMDFSIAIDLKPNHFNAYLFKTIGMDQYKKLIAQPISSQKNSTDSTNSHTLKQRNYKKVTRSIERKSSYIQFPKFEQKNSFTKQMKTNSNKNFSQKLNQISPFNQLTQNTNRQDQNQKSDFSFTLVDNQNQKSQDVKDHFAKSKSQQIFKISPPQDVDKKFNEYAHELANLQINKQNLQKSNNEKQTSETLVQHESQTYFSSEKGFEYFKSGLQNLTQKEYSKAHINFSESENYYISQSTNLSQTQYQFDEQQTLIEALAQLKEQSLLAASLLQEKPEQITDIYEQKKLLEQALLTIQKGTSNQQQFQLSKVVQQISQQLKKQNQDLKANQFQSEQQLEKNQQQVNQLYIVNDEEMKNQYQVSLIVRLFCYLSACQNIDKALQENVEINIEQENQTLQNILFETQQKCEMEIEQYSFPFNLFQIINESEETLQNKVNITQIKKLSQLLDQSIPQDSSLKREIILGLQQFKNQRTDTNLDLQQLPLELQETLKQILNIETKTEKDVHWLKGIYDFFIILSYLIEHCQKKNLIINNQLNEIIIQALNKNSFSDEIIRKNENNKIMVEQVERSCCCSCCTCCSSCCIIF